MFLDNRGKDQRKHDWLLSVRRPLTLLISGREAAWSRSRVEPAEQCVRGRLLLPDAPPLPRQQEVHRNTTGHNSKRIFSRRKGVKKA